MNNRPRPYIPLHVRLQVAARQIATSLVIMPYPANNKSTTLKRYLTALFGNDLCHLDHDPPLRTRAYNPKSKDVAARYTPNANDPKHLIYRTAEEHRIKTNVRGDGAQFSDRVLIKRERRRERPKKARRPKWPKRKFKWSSRPLRSRSFSQQRSKSRNHKPGYRPTRHIRRSP